MLHVTDIDADDMAHAPGSEPTPRGGRARASEGSKRSLARGDVLFQAGDSRVALYRVESGALMHYINWGDGRHEVIEYVFPGDIVGLGHLEHHVSTAQAMVETIVSRVSATEFENELSVNGLLAARLATAGDREFDLLKMQAARTSQRTPVARVAALLAALSHANNRDGRQAAVVGDDLTSGFVADRLAMSIADLAAALAELKRLGLVEAVSGGVRVNDLARLERIADAA